jgi:hypothetical protein
MKHDANRLAVHSAKAAAVVVEADSSPHIEAASINKVQ